MSLGPICVTGGTYQVPTECLSSRSSPSTSPSKPQRCVSMAIRDILCIRVLEESAECGVFLIKVQCKEPLLMQFWCSKPPFCNGHVEQADVYLETLTEIRFVLMVRHRGPNLPNSHYWSPFVLTLCLDARQFRFQLPSGGVPIQEILEERGELMLMR